MLFVKLAEKPFYIELFAQSGVAAILPPLRR